VFWVLGAGCWALGSRRVQGKMTSVPEITEKFDEGGRA
jgi:hypothetical protein